MSSRLVSLRGSNLGAHSYSQWVSFKCTSTVSQQIREQLRVIWESEISDSARLHLALTLPVEIGPLAVDVVLARLSDEELRGSPEQLISIAETHAPDRLRALALEFVAGHRNPPQWVGELLMSGSPNMREVAFETVWNALLAGEVQRLSLEFVGPLSNTAQTSRSVLEWLRFSVERRSNLSEVEQERGREIGYLLAHAPGDDLLNVVMERGSQASYEESVELVSLLLSRVSRGEGYASEVNPWLPTTAQFARLFDLFREKTEEGLNPQDRLFILLVSIASYVAPAEFGSLLIEALRRHLDAWTAYLALLEEWQKRPGAPRPNNPQMGNYILSALERWGMDALPDVLKLVPYPNASELVPEAIRRIASLPWRNTENHRFSSVSTDIQDGRQRRDAGCVLQQPSPAYQSVTDEAARALAGLLHAEVDRQLAERKANPQWNSRQSEYLVSKLVGTLANLPSVEIVTAVTRALASGLVGLYGFVDALRALIRQGWGFSDADVVDAFETLYERETSRSWVDESTRHTLATFSHLMFLVAHPAQLKYPLSHYLVQWRRFASSGEVIRAVGNMKTERAWSLLLELGTEVTARGAPTEELPYAVASTLSSDNFEAFTRLVADGTLFSWCRSVPMTHIAPAVAAIVKNAPEHMASLINCWRESMSLLADDLLAEVFRNLDVEDEMQVRLALEALDAGRANNPSMPAYRMLMRLFATHVPLRENQFEVHPKACNLLRMELYRRAKVGGETAGGTSRRILASLECGRREGGRPDDEPRHPESDDGLPWTNVLCLPDIGTA